MAEARMRKIDPTLGRTEAECVDLIIVGTPAPQGSKKFVGMRGGHAVLVESSKKVKPWREQVEFQARQTGKVIRGPVRLEITFYFARPKNHTLKGGGKSWAWTAWPITYPDSSKCLRSTEDALVTAGLIEDDSHVVTTLVWKLYADDRVPGAFIEVSRVD